MIDQSACNKDFSCERVLPSFVTVHGGTPKKRKARDFTLPDLPRPDLPSFEGTHNIVITGVGGTGVVTIGAIIAQAAQIDGKGAGMMEMAGLAQKGGAVHIHCRLAQQPQDISAIRISAGECDALIGGDLVVSTGSKTIGLTQAGRTRAVVNSHEIVTGEFTRNTDFRIPQDQLLFSLHSRLKERAQCFDATQLAEEMLGDSIYSNMLVFGAAWQRGLVPLSYEAILQAIELNGAAVEGNKRALDIGRWAALFPKEAEAPLIMSRQSDKRLRRKSRHLKNISSPIRDDVWQRNIASGYIKEERLEKRWLTAIVNFLLTRTNMKSRGSI